MPAAFPDGNASDAYKQASRIDPLAEDESKTSVSSEQSQVRENEYDASALEGDEAKIYGLLKEAGKPRSFAGDSTITSFDI